MQSLDSLTLKYFFEENFDFIKGANVQKIQLPTRYEVILNLRFNKINKKLYININPKYPHICFVEDDTLGARNIQIPKKPPAFCMQLRKYLQGSQIKDFRLKKYDRILEFDFDYIDEIGSLTRLTLAVELMGKYSNIILYNKNNKIIIGSIHNISKDKSSIREIYGGVNYIYPPLKEKLDILNTSYGAFVNVDDISENFYYFSCSLLEKVPKENTFEFLQKLSLGENKDFIINYWGGGDSVSCAIDSYFSRVMFFDIIKNLKNKLKKPLEQEMKKILKTSSSLPDIEKQELYKIKGDLILANLHNIKEGENVLLYGDIKIELDTSKTPSENAQKYYSLYKKSKSAYEHAIERTKASKERLLYLEGVIFDIENSQDFDQLREIEQELGQIRFDKKTQPKIETREFKGYQIFIGKNNKQNDFIISKIARGEDLWFHGLNFPSSHVVLRLPNDKPYPAADVIEYCAKLTKEHSKARNSGKTSIIMTKRKNLKKPPDTYLGYVTYKNETEIVI